MSVFPLFRCTCVWLMRANNKCTTLKCTTVKYTNGCMRLGTQLWSLCTIRAHFSMVCGGGECNRAQTRTYISTNFCLPSLQRLSDLHSVGPFHLLKPTVDVEAERPLRGSLSSSQKKRKEISYIHYDEWLLLLLLCGQLTNNVHNTPTASNCAHMHAWARGHVSIVKADKQGRREGEATVLWLVWVCPELPYW